MEWRTSISSAGEDAEIRGEDLENVMDLPFSDAVFLVLSGRKPSDNESELFSTILSSCVDHGVGNPSTVSARTVQSGGNEPNTSIAAGILAMGDSHGGAITPCMEMLRGEEPRSAVKSRLESGEKVPGLGHKVYEDGDPRAERILELAEDLGTVG
nr:MAG: citrate synthase [Candidatus Nanosalinarum sp. J07AB56]